MAVLGSNTLNHSANLLIQRAGTTRITVTSTGITVGGTLNGFTIVGASGNRWTNIPAVASNGVMEIGRYIDFHSTAGNTTNFTYRIDNTSNGNLAFSGDISFGTATGALSGNATTATTATNCSRQIINGNGMDFTGGQLNTNRTITLGTPSTITGATTNSVTTSSHTHALTVNLSVTGGTTGGPRINSSAGTNATIPTASATASGVVTTGNQTWAGNKTFNGNLTVLNTQASNFWIRNTAPTIHLRDTDHNTAFLHCNSNIFYVLRGGTDATTWTAVGGQWPLVINLTNNDATFGRDLYAIRNVIGYASDKRLKENFNHIKTPLEKIQKLNGYSFDWKDIVKELGFTPSHEKNDIGLIAQEVQEVLPQAVFPAPFDQEWKGESNGSKSGENYLTIQYERLVPLLVEAIKEQQTQINNLTKQIEKLKE